MEHALSFAITVGLLGLTWLTTLLPHQGWRMLAALKTARMDLATQSSSLSTSAATAGQPAHILMMSTASHKPHRVDARSSETSSTERESEPSAVDPKPGKDEDPLVRITAFDSQGNPRPRWVPLSTLLRAVGIHTSADDPGIAVIAQAQCEIRALAQLSTNLGTHGGEDMDFADLGLALEGISYRLDVASEIIDAVQEVRLRKASRTSTEEPPDSAEAPPSDDAREKV